MSAFFTIQVQTLYTPQHKEHRNPIASDPMLTLKWEVFLLNSVMIGSVVWAVNLHSQWLQLQWLVAKHRMHGPMLALNAQIHMEYSMNEKMARNSEYCSTE